MTSLFIADEDEIVEGALYGMVGGDTSERLLHVRHLNAGLLQVLFVIHVAMIAIYLVYARLNLVPPHGDGAGACRRGFRAGRAALAAGRRRRRLCRVGNGWRRLALRLAPTPLARRALA